MKGWPFHRHRWESVSAQQMSMETYQTGPLAAKDWAGRPLQVGPDLPVTEILQRCECGDVRTRTVNGWWTAEDIR